MRKEDVLLSARENAERRKMRSTLGAGSFGQSRVSTFASNGRSRRMFASAPHWERVRSRRLQNGRSRRMRTTNRLPRMQIVRLNSRKTGIRLKWRHKEDNQYRRRRRDGRKGKPCRRGSARHGGANPPVQASRLRAKEVSA